MSKIPYADPQKGNEQGKEEKFWNPKTVRALISSLIVLILTGVIIGVVEYYTLTNGPEGTGKDKNLIMHILSDSFSLSGLLGLCFFALSYISSKGAFDILAYSIQTLFLVTFRPKYRQTSFPKTYYDYKVMKDTKRKKPVNVLLLSSGTFFVVGIILLIIYVNI